MFDHCEIIDATATPDELGLTALPTPSHHRFALGDIYCTPGALETLDRLAVTPQALLERHAAGDWGDIDPDDTGLNEHALQTGDRVFSVYALAGGARVWIITEADRASTTVLLPDEY